jgi:hypothetical protein
VVLRASQLGILDSCLSLGFLASPGWWVCLFGICANYIMHAFIWNCPSEFKQLCKGPLKALGSHPVDVFAALEVVAKAIQFLSLAFFFGADGRRATVEAIFGAPSWCWLVLLLLLAAGQILNFAMYGAIGNAGVYYGFKLGREVPWAYGFPFNVGLRHPQYTGVVLTLWAGLIMVLCKELTALWVPQMVVVWASMYAVMSAMEQMGDNNKETETSGKEAKEETNAKGRENTNGTGAASKKNGKPRKLD